MNSNPTRTYRSYRSKYLSLINQCGRCRLTHLFSSHARYTVCALCSVHISHTYQGGVWKFFQNRSSNQRSGMILEVFSKILARVRAAGAGARASKFSFFKKFQGAQIYFFMQIGMELPFTLKNKDINTNLKFYFLIVPFQTPKNMRFWFLQKTHPKIYFLRVSAFNQL